MITMYITQSNNAYCLLDISGEVQTSKFLLQRFTLRFCNAPLYIKTNSND